jgi:Terpene synthase family 2, C-terminal metal binding
VPETMLGGILYAYYPTTWQTYNELHGPRVSLTPQIVSWGLHTNLLTRPEARKTFEALGLDSFVRMVFPDCNNEGLLLLFGKYICWLFLFDDILEEISPLKDAAALEFVEPYVAFLDSGDIPLGGLDPLFASFIELTQELYAEARDPEFKIKWSESHLEYMLRGYLDSVLLDTKLLPSQRAQMSKALWARMFDSNVLGVFDLAELSRAESLPLTIRSHPWVREMRYIAALASALFNDLTSYEKERFSSLTNLVLRIERLLKLKPEDALQCAVSFQNKLIALFEERTQTMHPELNSPSLESYLKSLGTVFYGLGQWQLGSLRYSGCKVEFVSTPRIDERFSQEINFLCQAVGISGISKDQQED